jgi:DNA helicase II / ATP-dependent DNA helicase PcrA
MKTSEAIEEERRLFYVAVTRAETHLTLTYPLSAFDPATGGILCEPSRFLGEIGSEHLERWVLRR